MTANLLSTPITVETAPRLAFVRSISASDAMFLPDGRLLTLDRSAPVGWQASIWRPHDLALLEEIDLDPILPLESGKRSVDGSTLTIVCEHYARWSSDQHLTGLGGSGDLFDARWLLSDREAAILPKWLRFHSSSEEALLKADLLQELKRKPILDGTHFLTIHSASLGDGSVLSEAHVLTGDYGLLELSPDGRWIATARDRVPRLWSAVDGTLVHQLKGLMQSHGSRVIAIKFSSDSSVLASISEDGTIKLWRNHEGKRIYGDSYSTTTRSARLIFSPNSACFAITLDWLRGAVHVYDVRKKKLLNDGIRHGQDVWAMAFTPDNSLLATAANDNSVRLWRVRPKAFKNILLHEMVATPGYGRLEFSPDGCMLLAHSNRVLHIWGVS